MKTKLIAFALLSLGITASADIGYQFVTVGNPGNENDTVNKSNPNYGAVSYTYDIGKYDVTLNQYTMFLNAVASSDPYGLYNSGMATSGNYSGLSTGAGILRLGLAGSYSYSVIGNSGNNPVTLVNWLDAARFCNWLNNGQPTGLGEVTGSTEQGAYALNGDTTGGFEKKNANAQYWIPSESEWYKAAYYDPNKGGPGVGGYWLYPTRSNTAPGNVIGSGTNQANMIVSGTYSVTQSSTYSNTQSYLSNVGAFTNSASAYGTYDQGGEDYELTDSVVGSTVTIRGGWWDGFPLQLRADSWAGMPPSGNGTAFRVATVPEPSTYAFLGAGILSLLAWRRRVR